MSAAPTNAKPTAEELGRFLDWSLKRKTPLEVLCKKAGYDPVRIFVGASLVNRDFRRRNLRSFNFTRADVRGADFRNADITGVCFAGASTLGAIGLPPPLKVFFSYAWLDVSDEHNVQDQFYESLRDKLTYPLPEFNSLPRIELWRDEVHLRSTDPGDRQIDVACKEAFLGLLMVSHKYPYSKICMREASFFLDQEAESSKRSYLIVGVNVGHREMPDEFTRNLRKIMLGENGKTLVTLWLSTDGTERLEFVRSVSREIFIAARRFLQSHTYKKELPR